MVTGRMTYCALGDRLTIRVIRADDTKTGIRIKKIKQDEPYNQILD